MICLRLENVLPLNHLFNIIIKLIYIKHKDILNNLQN